MTSLAAWDVMVLISDGLVGGAGSFWAAMEAVLLACAATPLMASCAAVVGAAVGLGSSPVPPDWRATPESCDPIWLVESDGDGWPAAIGVVLGGEATGRDVRGMDGQQQLVELARVEAGREYKLLVTTYVGLSRYLVGDVLHVTSGGGSRTLLP